MSKQGIPFDNFRSVEVMRHEKFYIQRTPFQGPNSTIRYVYFVCDANGKEYGQFDLLSKAIKAFKDAIASK